MDYKRKLEYYLNVLRELGYEISYLSELAFESLQDFSSKGSLDELIEWYESIARNPVMRVDKIPLHECREWMYDRSTGEFRHSSGEFFRIEGYRVSGTHSREVNNGWDQPLVTQQGFDGGILGLLRKRFQGIPHYLIEIKDEPGNYRISQITTTVQATFSNLKRAHEGRAPHYADLFLNPEKYSAKILIDQWMSEDGGRLFNKRNRSMLVELSEEENFEIVTERFKWVSLYQIKYLIRNYDAIIAPHLRGILSGV